MLVIDPDSSYRKDMISAIIETLSLFILFGNCRYLSVSFVSSLLSFWPFKSCAGNIPRSSEMEKYFEYMVSLSIMAKPCCRPQSTIAALMEPSSEKASFSVEILHTGIAPGGDSRRRQNCKAYDSPDLPESG